MRLASSLLFIAVLTLFTSCRKEDNDNNNSVVSKRYIHKYGYAVSQGEWEAHNYPGQVVTAMRDGVTVTTSYEHGILHGPSTYTFPHSQIVETYFLYNNGNLIKEIKYDRHGMPLREEVRLSPTRYTTTTWYANGSPLSVEEYASEELVEGQYFNAQNETEARVDKGTGKRIVRDMQGVLLSRDVIEKGFLVKRESFYANGAPQSIAHYTANKLDGERRIFSQEGEPLAIEEWKGGKLHGLVVTFENGVKLTEAFYLDGEKNGVERRYVDGDIISQEVSWENDKRHGPSVYYIDGQTRTEWYYDGSLVSQARFAEYDRLDEMISHISPDAAVGGAR
jgi:antitoxin component YwqK of YwqJK toxin-antitoxin module